MASDLPLENRPPRGPFWRLIRSVHGGPSLPMLLMVSILRDASMRPNDRCLSLYDEWTRSLEGCGGAVFDAHRLSFRILPVLETTCPRAAESQVVVDARRARTLDALPSIEYEHGANSGALAVVATDPSGARGLLCACAPPSSSLLGPGSHWDENAFERLKTHRLTPSTLHQDRIAKAAAAEAQGASWFDG